jgi:hypothetical protein
MVGTIQDEVVLGEDFDCRLRCEVVWVAVVDWVGVETVLFLVRQNETLRRSKSAWYEEAMGTYEDRYSTALSTLLMPTRPVP